MEKFYLAKRDFFQRKKAFLRRRVAAKPEIF